MEAELMPDSGLFASLDQLVASPGYAVFVVVWLAVCLIGTAIYRLRCGTLFPRTTEGALFAEGWTSGYSERNLLTQLGGARNCLHVVLTRERLTIALEFPFTLMPFDFIYDLKQDIPISGVTAVREHSALFGRTVQLEFERGDGRRRSYRLRLRSPEAFLAAVRQVAPGVIS